MTAAPAMQHVRLALWSAGEPRAPAQGPAGGDAVNANVLQLAPWLRSAGYPLVSAARSHAERMPGGAGGAGGGGGGGGAAAVSFSQQRFLGAARDAAALQAPYLNPSGAPWYVPLAIGPLGPDAEQPPAAAPAPGPAADALLIAPDGEAGGAAAPAAGAPGAPPGAAAAAGPAAGAGAAPLGGGGGARVGARVGGTRRRALQQAPPAGGQERYLARAAAYQPPPALPADDAIDNFQAAPPVPAAAAPPFPSAAAPAPGPGAPGVFAVGFATPPPAGVGRRGGVNPGVNPAAQLGNTLDNQTLSPAAAAAAAGAGAGGAALAAVAPRWLVLDAASSDASEAKVRSVVAAQTLNPGSAPRRA